MSIDMRDYLIREYITADEISILNNADYWIKFTGEEKIKEVTYGDKTKEEAYAEVEYTNSKRKTWLKLNNPIMKVLIPLSPTVKGL